VRIKARYLRCGRVIVLALPALAAPPPGAPAAPLRGPVNAGTYVALSGQVRAALVSQAAVMHVVAVFHGRAPYSAVAWAPDERQLVATGEDACVSVFNFFA
jgi:hypothetical protein